MLGQTAPIPSHSMPKIPKNANAADIETSLSEAQLGFAAQYGIAWNSSTVRKNLEDKVRYEIMERVSCGA